MSLFSKKKCTLRDESRGEKKERWSWIYRNCTFYLSQGHFWNSDWKNEEDEKSGKSWKRCQVAKPVVTFPIEKVHIHPWDATVAFTVWRWGSKRKKKSNQRFLRVVRFTQTRDTFLPVTKKGRKGEKDRKSWKRCQMDKKSIMVRNRPQSGTKQSIWRKYKTGLYEMMSVWS